MLSSRVLWCPLIRLQFFSNYAVQALTLYDSDSDSGSDDEEDYAYSRSGYGGHHAQSLDHKVSITAAAGACQPGTAATEHDQASHNDGTRSEPPDSPMERKVHSPGPVAEGVGQHTHQYTHHHGHQQQQQQHQSAHAAQDTCDFREVLLDIPEDNSINRDSKKSYTSHGISQDKDHKSDEQQQQQQQQEYTTEGSVCQKDVDSSMPGQENRDEHDELKKDKKEPETEEQIAARKARAAQHWDYVRAAVFDGRVVALLMNSKHYSVVTATFKRMFPEDFDRAIPVVNHRRIDELMFKLDNHYQKYEKVRCMYGCFYAPWEPTTIMGLHVLSHIDR